ncbi:MAG: ABC transporter ATP-binding protein, partial [Clostridia bacterium]
MKKNYTPDKISFYLKKQMPTLLLTLFFGVVYNVIFVFAPTFQGKLLDAIIFKQPLKLILISACIFFCVVLATQVARFLKRFFVRRFANETMRTMRAIMYDDTIALPLKTLDNIQLGDIMTRCVGDVDIAVEGMRKCLTEILDTGIAMIAYIAMLLSYDVVATLVGCACAFVATAIALALKKFVYRFSKQYRDSSSALTSSAYQLTSNTLLFRHYGVMDAHLKDFEQKVDVTQSTSIKSNLIANALPTIYKVVASIGVIFVIYVGGKKTISAEWTIGTFTAYLTLFLAFSIKASKISSLFSTVQKAKISWQRAKKYFATESASSDFQHCDIDCNGSIFLCVRNLTYEYQPNHTVFKPISFDASQGQIVGLVGNVASGKTSALLALSAINGYVGSITINDYQLCNIDPVTKSKLISMSAHNSFLLDDTITNNIAIGRNVTTTDLLIDVGFDKDMASMPERQDTLVGSDGVRLSGGQQARLSLARALAGNNKIVLLDDPFSAIDLPTEKTIIDNIRKN